MLFYRYLVLLQLQVKNLRFTMWLLYYFAVLQLQFKFQIVLVSLYFFAVLQLQLLLNSSEKVLSKNTLWLIL